MHDDDGLSVRARAAQRDAERPRCRHGLLFSSPQRPLDECRECLPDGTAVDDWMADNPAPTLDEVGQVFGCTRERIRQIEEKALAKLDALFVKALGADAPERGERLLDAQRTERVIARMRRDGFSEDEITDAVGSATRTLHRPPPQRTRTHRRRDGGERNTA